ncbi:MAG: Ig-like domain-containing protein, partial [Eubacterium sp.]|nr:Ig-like domain-containing protein [Eubacterium sp.]
VATVDAYGKVKAKKKGKATITVKCGKKSAKLKLTVKK